MKEKKRKIVKAIVNLAGGLATNHYAYLLLTTMCPPAGIVAGVGCGLLSGAIGDMGGDKAERIVDSVYQLIDGKTAENPED